MHENLGIPYFFFIVCTFVTCRSLLFGSIFFSNLSYTSQVRSWNVHVCISYHSKIMLQTHGGSFIRHKKNDANSSMQRLQSYVCRSPQKKEKKCYTHVYTGSIDVSMKLDLNCAWYIMYLCYNTWWQKKRYMQSAEYICHVNGGDKKYFLSQFNGRHIM